MTNAAAAGMRFKVDVTDEATLIASNSNPRRIDVTINNAKQFSNSRDFAGRPIARKRIQVSNSVMLLTLVNLPRRTVSWSNVNVSSVRYLSAPLN